MYATLLWTSNVYRKSVKHMEQRKYYNTDLYSCVQFLFPFYMHYNSHNFYNHN